MSSNGEAQEFTGFEFSVIIINSQEDTSERYEALKAKYEPTHGICVLLWFLVKKPLILSPFLEKVPKHIHYHTLIY